MDNGPDNRPRSPDSPSEAASSSRPEPKDSLIASPSQESYPDPPPTYHHATENQTNDNDSTEGEEITDEYQRRWRKKSTMTSVTTTTTTTSTSTTTSTLAPATKPKRPFASRTSTLKRSKSIESFQSTEGADPYLDSLLARSIAALELSNALLQSTMATKSTLSNVLASGDELDRQGQLFEERFMEGGGLALAEARRREWMEEMQGIVKDVESLFDLPPLPDPDLNSPPSTIRRRASVDSQYGGAPVATAVGKRRADGAGLVFGESVASVNARSPPPRALTQYVSISGASARAPGGFAAESTADKYSIYLPSTTGLRSIAHKESLHVPTSSTSSTFSNQSVPEKVDVRDARRVSTSSASSLHPSSSFSTSRGLRDPSLNRPPRAPPPTHPESLPLSTQELLLLQSSENPDLIRPSTSPLREDPYKYLRQIGARTNASSANSSISKSSRTDIPIRPSLSPRQPRASKSRDRLQHAQTPSTTAFTSFAIADTQSHTRTDSATSSATSHSTRSSLSSSKRLPTSNLPLPFSPTSASRRSPSLKSPTLLSPTQSTFSDSSEVQFDWYSPSLEAIPDHHDEGDESIPPPEESVIDRGRTISPGKLWQLFSEIRFVSHLVSYWPDQWGRLHLLSRKCRRDSVDFHSRTAREASSLLLTEAYTSCGELADVAHTPGPHCPCGSPFDLGKPGS
ncbi:hypothetical protein CPB86DRAFT_338263 [Serendipita vermifera]|nr:hypothetical protein CPB86DRAFT_338263 [Serendipita vermifera]